MAKLFESRSGTEGKHACSRSVLGWGDRIGTHFHGLTIISAASNLVV